MDCAQAIIPTSLQRSEISIILIPRSLFLVTGVSDSIVVQIHDGPTPRGDIVSGTMDYITVDESNGPSRPDHRLNTTIISQFSNRLRT